MRTLLGMLGFAFCTPHICESMFESHEIISICFPFHVLAFGHEVKVKITTLTFEF
jgi:hypothetical protein